MTGSTAPDREIPPPDYRDPAWDGVDVDVVIRRGRRAIARRRTGRIMATAAGVAVVAVVVSQVVHRSNDVTPSALSDGQIISKVLDDSIARDHPPGPDGARILDRSVPGWAVVAWRSAAGEGCGGVLSTSKDDRDAPSSLNCWGPAPAGTAPAVLGKPVFQSLPLPADTAGRTVAIGFVAGDVASVRVVFRGLARPAKTVVVSANDPGQVEAYAVWLPTKESDGYGAGDVSAVDALDPAGSPVAQLR